LARLGGDEFVAILSDLRDDAGAIAVADKFHDAFETPMQVGSAEFGLGTSVGIAMYPRDGIDAVELMKLADLRMLEDKRHRQSKTGRGRGDAYTP
jgi:diguanylate cyclase (GGDEF)-like protein